MNMDESKELFEKKHLENNLELVMYSHFRHTAGDRCQVTFKATIEVEIKGKYFSVPALKNLDFNRVTSILGGNTSYSYSKTRNFIPEDKKYKTLKDLKHQFLDNNLAYISSPSFPSKLIKRNYVIAEKEEMIRIKREEYLKNTL